MKCPKCGTKLNTRFATPAPHKIEICNLCKSRVIIERKLIKRYRPQLVKSTPFLLIIIGFLLLLIPVFRELTPLLIIGLVLYYVVGAFVIVYYWNWFLEVPPSTLNE